MSKKIFNIIKINLSIFVLTIMGINFVSIPVLAHDHSQEINIFNRQSITEPHAYITETIQPLLNIIFEPLSVESPELEAYREALMLDAEGGRLLEDGYVEDAREKWKAAIDAYERADHQLSVSKVYMKLGHSVMVRKRMNNLGQRRRANSLGERPGVGRP
ncbi:MAG: hypothetical protein AAF639_45945 [Chloroflexota bacterium]